MMTQTDSSPGTPDEDFQPISALNDLLYCERRCALHRIEQIWEENQFTLSGTGAHRRVHAEPSREELGAKGTVVRGMWLRSQRLRLVGKADAVEFPVGPACRAGPVPADSEVVLSNERPRATVPAATLRHVDRMADAGGELSSGPARQAGPTAYPIEYKHGRRRRWDNDDVQLCAQALCLEEMLGISVPAGAIFHVKSRRRREVAFDQALRAKTEQAARRLHQLVAAGRTPPAVRKPQCNGCSLHELCMPELMSLPAGAREYVETLYATG